jgi:hypothetical protein
MVNHNLNQEEHLSDRIDNVITIIKNVRFHSMRGNTPLEGYEPSSLS